MTLADRHSGYDGELRNAAGRINKAKTAGVLLGYNIVQAYNVTEPLRRVRSVLTAKASAQGQ